MKVEIEKNSVNSSLSKKPNSIKKRNNFLAIQSRKKTQVPRLILSHKHSSLETYSAVISLSTLYSLAVVSWNHVLGTHYSIFNLIVNSGSWIS